MTAIDTAVSTACYACNAARRERAADDQIAAFDPWFCIESGSRARSEETKKGQGAVLEDHCGVRIIALDTESDLNERMTSR